MRALTEKINKECKASKNLREYANKVGCDRGIEIRKEQQKHYDKYVFFRNLGIALDKEGGK